MGNSDVPAAVAQPATVTGGTLNILQFGAKGDGVSDDAPAFRKAFQALASSGGGTLVIPKTAGAYLMRTWEPTPRDGLLFIAFIPSNVTLTGDGTIKIKDNIYPAVTNGAGGVYYGVNLFGSFGGSNIVVSGLTFDMNGQHNLQPAGLPHIMNTFRFYSGRNVVLQQITVKNSAGHNMVVFQEGAGNGAVVRNSTFSIGGHGIPGNTRNSDFSFVYSEWSHTQYLNNHIIQSAQNDHASGGFEIHGSHSVATGNIIENCNPGFWIASSPGPLEDVVVSGNDMRDVNRGIAFWVSDTFKNVHLLKNTIRVKYNPVFTQLYGKGDDAAGIVGPWLGSYYQKAYTAHTANGSAIENLEIKGNTIYSNDGVLPVDTEPGISIHGVHNALITGNNIYNIGSSGIVVYGSPWGNRNIVITRNTIRNFGRTSGPSVPAAITVDTNGTSLQPFATAFDSRGIVITGNTIAQPVRGSWSGFLWLWPTGYMHDLILGANFLTNLGTPVNAYPGTAPSVVNRQPVEGIGTPANRTSCASGNIQWRSGVDVLDGWMCTGGAWQQFGPAPRL